MKSKNIGLFNLQDPKLAWGMAESHFRAAQLVWETYGVEQISIEVRNEVKSENEMNKQSNCKLSFVKVFCKKNF